MTKVTYQRKTKEEKQAQLKILSEQLNQQIDQFVESPEILREYVRFSKNFHQYSLKNRLMIHRQSKSAQFVGSYKYWKEKGYSVKKGEKGMQVFVPRTEKTFSRDGKQYISVKFATIQEKRLIAEGKLKTTNQMIGVSVGHVFDISQTNMPLNEYPEYLSREAISKEDFNYQNLLKAGKQYSESKNISITYQDLPINVGGYYQYDKKSIVLNNQYENENLFSVLIHELAHSQLHDGSELSRNEKEVQAQAVAELVKHYYELPSSDHDLSYLKSYTQKMSSEERFSLIEQTLNVVTELTTTIDDYLVNQVTHEQTRENYQLESNFNHSDKESPQNTNDNGQQHYSKQRKTNKALDLSL